MIHHGVNKVSCPCPGSLLCCCPACLMEWNLDQPFGVSEEGEILVCFSVYCSSEAEQNKGGSQERLLQRNYIEVNFFDHAKWYMIRMQLKHGGLASMFDVCRWGHWFCEDGALLRDQGFVITCESSGQLMNDPASVQFLAKPFALSSHTNLGISVGQYSWSFF